MPLPLTVSCFSKIHIGFTFLVPTHPGSPGKGPLNGCVCVYITGANHDPDGGAGISGRPGLQNCRRRGVGVFSGHPRPSHLTAVDDAPSSEQRALVNR